MFSKLLSVLFLSALFCTPSFATYTPTPTCVKIGTYQFQDCDNLIVLYAQVTSNSMWSTFVKNDGTSYTPSGGNAFRVYAVRGETTSSAIGGGYFWYSDTNLGSDSATAPTNRVYFWNAVTGTAYTALGNFSLTWSPTEGSPPANGERAWGKSGPLMPNGKYMSFQSNAAQYNRMWMYGYEE